MNETNEIFQGNDSLGNILVVDDNNKNLQIISMALTKYGYKVAVANSGANALKYLEKKHPDLILLDIMMPDIDGYELCSIIKSKDEINHIPIIFLTAKSDLKDLVDGFKLGAVDYLLKPFRNEELNVRVSTHVQLKKSKDIIKQKNMELEELNRKIIDNQNKIVNDAQKLMELNEKLIESEEQLIKLNESKDKFFSILAHDLRGPFSALLGLSEIMNKDFHQLSNDESAEIAGLIHNTSVNVYSLLDELLQWSQSQLGKMDFKSKLENIHKLGEEGISLYRHSAEKKNITINNLINPELNMNVDKNMLTAVFRNLIGNAIKFTDYGGEISVKSIIMDDEVTFIVRDNGVGMTQQAADNLFTINSIVSTLGTDGERGSGLGLLLVKEFIDKHSGSLRIKSELNKGTEVCFSIPVRSL